MALYKISFTDMLNILINYQSSCRIVFIVVVLAFICNLVHFELFVWWGCFDCFDYDCWFVGEGVACLGLEKYGSRCWIGVRVMWVILKCILLRLVDLGVGSFVVDKCFWEGSFVLVVGD
jgi:hypothetical protein